MIKNQILIFLSRWFVSSVGMWLVIRWFGTVDDGITGGLSLYIIAGLVFSLVNSTVRPFTTMLSLPLIIFSMGIFTILINVAMMALTVWILPGIHITFWGAVFGTVAISILNGLINLLVPSRQPK